MERSLGRRVHGNGRTGTGTQRSSEPTEAVVDQAHDAQLEYYYRNDLTIGKTSSMLANYVFRNKWMVRWGGVIPMAYFAIPKVQQVLERHMRDIRDLRRLKRYAVVWAYRDMEGWMKEFEASMKYTNNIPNDALVLPCGIATPDMGRVIQIAPRGVYSATRILTFEPASEEIDATYRFMVYDCGARFYDITASNPTGSGLGSMLMYPAVSLNSHTIRVASEFAELYEMRSKLEESESYQFNTAFAAAFPLAYMTAKAMPHDPIEEITDESLVTAKDMNDARSKNKSLHNMKFTLSTAIKMAKSMTRAMSAATGKNITLDNATATMDKMPLSFDSTVRKAIAENYARVDPSENVVPLPDFVDVSATHPPSVVIDVAQLRTQYEIAVCRCMDVPYSFYRTELETSGNTSGASNMILSESIISNAVADEQKIYIEIFSWLYTNVFSMLDKALFDAIADDVDAMSDLEVKSPDTQHVIRFLTDMVGRPDSYAKLEFELLTVTNPESLNAMIQAQQMGLVSRHLVERNAARLYGHTLGRDGNQFALRPDPSLRTNFNAPLQPPVTPDTEAKLENDKELAKMKPPPAKKQKTQ